MVESEQALLARKILPSQEGLSYKLGDEQDFGTWVYFTMSIVSEAQYDKIQKKIASKINQGIRSQK